MAPSDPTLSNREQAIAWLTQCGLRAREHTGWLGNAISVSRPEVHSGEGQRLREEALIIYPEGDAWCVARSLPGRRGLNQRFQTLGDAVKYVLTTLSALPK